MLIVTLLAIKLQKRYLLRLDNLLTGKDTIDLCYLKVLLVGPPGVGKTTTLNRLLKAYENIRAAGDTAKRRSTLLANCTQVLAFVGQDETADWLSSSIGDDDQEAILLIRYLCGDKLEEPTQDEEVTIPNTQEDVEGTYETNIPTENEPEEETATEQIILPPSQDETPPPQAEVEESLEPTANTLGSAKKLEHLQSIKGKLRKLLQSGNYTKAISHLGNTLLNINDVGGQPGFLEMLPALSTGPAMYLVFLDLSKELNQFYEITFDRDNKVITPFKSVHTVESTVSQILSSIASAHCVSHASTSFDLHSLPNFEEKLQSFQKIKPVAALIGTHLDMLVDQEKKMKQVSDSLKKVTDKFKSIIISPPQKTTTSPFFSVNNYDGKEAMDIAPIRNFMNKIFSKCLPTCAKEVADPEYHSSKRVPYC